VYADTGGVSFPVVGDLVHRSGSFEEPTGQPECCSPPGCAPHNDALGLLRLWQDDHAAARALLGESARLARRIGDLDRWAWTTASLIISRAMGGDPGDDIESLALRAVEVARAHGTRTSLARALCGLALLRSTQGRQAEASQLMEQCLRLLEYMTWARGKFSYFLGWFAFLDGNLNRAAGLLATSLSAFELIHPGPQRRDRLRRPVLEHGRPAHPGRLAPTPANPSRNLTRAALGGWSNRRGQAAR
jgi:hypothetical protein